MSQEALDDLFNAAEPGPIPDGEAKGTAIIAPGTQFSDEIAQLGSVFAWQAKVFDAERGVLRRNDRDLDDRPGRTPRPTNLRSPIAAP